MSGWISVKDQLPEMTELYLGGPKRARVLIFSGWVGEGSYEETLVRRTPKWKNAIGLSSPVTHWMPLPAPPETKKVSND